MRNQTSFRLTTTLLPTDLTAKTTTVINKVDAGGNKFLPNFTEETIVLTNDDRTIMETTRATCENGVLTFIKRGLSDDNLETEIANRKLTRNPGSLCFITAGAGDWLDKDDDITWTGNQTYTGSSTYEGMLITQKGVKYPNFANVAALEAYGTPYGGMFATVDDTGELYRYNANTHTWAMVSNVDVGQYVIRVEEEIPAPGTADTIVTMLPNLHSIYVGDKAVVADNYIDVLLVGGGGGGGGALSSTTSAGGGGGGGGTEYKTAHRITGNIFNVRVGAGGIGGTNGAVGENGGQSAFGPLYALGGGGGGGFNKPGVAGANGGGGGASTSESSPNSGGTGYASQSNQGHSGGTGVLVSSWTGSVRGGQGGSLSADGGTETDLVNGASFNLGGEGVTVSTGGGGGYGQWNQTSGGGSNDSYTIGASSSVYGGGGGGAAYHHTLSKGSLKGGNGVGGLVKIAYPTDGTYGFTNATGGTITTSTALGKEYKIHTFTSDGTFTIIS